MSFCRNCGRENPEESKACIYCGADILDEGEATKAEAIEVEAVEAEIVEPKIPEEPPIETPIQDRKSIPIEEPTEELPNFTDKFHEAGKGTIFMIGMILFSVASVFSVFAQLVQIGNARVMAGISAVGFLFNLAIIALACTAGWLIYAASLKPKLPEKSITSMTLLKVLTIIQIVLVSIFVAGLIIVSLFFFAGSDAFYKLIPYSSYSMQRGSIAVIGVGMLLGALIYGAIYFPYAIACLKTIKSMKLGLMYQSIQKIEGAKTVAIYTFIFAGFAIIGSLFSWVTPFGSTSNFLIELIRQSAMVLFAVVLLQFNKEYSKS